MKLEIKIDRVLLIFYLLALLAFPYYANSLYKWINMITTVIFFLFECRSLLKYRLIRNIIRKNQYISWLLIVAFLVMFASFWSEDLSYQVTPHALRGSKPENSFYALIPAWKP